MGLEPCPGVGTEGRTAVPVGTGLRRTGRPQVTVGTGTLDVVDTRRRRGRLRQETVGFIRGTVRDTLWWTPVEASQDGGLGEGSSLLCVVGRR